MTSTGHFAPVWAANCIEETSYFSFTSSGNASILTKWVGTINADSVLYFSIVARVVSASNLPNITDGIPRVRSRIPDNGPV